MLPNFSFIDTGKLAGSGLPGMDATVLEDLDEARRRGVGAVVSLTERPLDAEDIAASKLAYLHLPVVDFQPPSLAQLDRFVSFVQEQVDAGRGVLAHCFAGRGRTGTVLAAWLIANGKSAREAIAEVRRRRPGSIETRKQEAVLEEYERHRTSRAVNETPTRTP